MGKNRVTLRGRVRFTPEEVDEIFERARHQGEYVLALYRRVIPDWDRVVSVNGWPSAGRALSEYISGKAIAFDREHHQDDDKVVLGGLWLNNGFAMDPSLPDWEVSVDGLEIEYKAKAA